ncbi:MAG: endonuclease III, partial [Clostridia bacterium]|nr:endonuclease III [Clostridia bacterium]
IYTCCFYRNKARNIILASRDIVEKFGGKVPQDIKSLMTLAGVGKKTANVVYSVAFGGQAIAVDTHVLRLSNRIGFCDSDDPLKVEDALMRILPKECWSRAHHLLIHHGRYTCSARNPQCSNCLISEYCEHFNGK